MQSQPLHITLATVPQQAITSSSLFGANLEHDLQMVKGAILYADKVRLCSPAASFALGILDLQDFTEVQQVEYYGQFVRYVLPERLPFLVPRYERFRKLSRPGAPRTVADMLFMRDFKAMIHEHWREMLALVREQAHGTEAETLRRAIQEGLVELHPFSIENINAIVGEYLDLFRQALSDGSTFPLLDADASEMVGDGIDAGLLAPSAVDVGRGRHSGLAASILERLPLFDKAPLDAVFDIRSELARPLIRFRSAVTSYSQKMQTAPWDADFSKEADSIFRQEVEPALLDLEDSIKSNSLLCAMISRLSARPQVALTGGMLSLLATQLPVLSNLVTQSMVASIGMAGTAGAAVVDAVLESRKDRRANEQHRLFFLYRASERLSAARRRK